MSKTTKFKWTTTTDPDGVNTYEGENERFVGCVEYVGDDLFENPMWYASLFDKEYGRPVPVSDFGTPFTSSHSAKEAITRALNKESLR